MLAGSGGRVMPKGGASRRVEVTGESNEIDRAVGVSWFHGERIRAPSAPTVLPLWQQGGVYFTLIVTIVYSWPATIKI